MTRWYFGLDAKAIQDGHHPDFFRGQQAEFAVDVSWASWKPAEFNVPSAQRVEDCLYDLVAEVVGVTAEGLILDCGLLVHGLGAASSQEVSVGSWLSGRARLGVGRAHDAAVPARSWYVERVFHRVEPVAEMTDPRLLMVDVEELGWEELAFTDAWHDDDGQADYLLECVAVGAA